MERFKSKEFDWKAARPSFFDGFHRSLAAYAGAGNNLILEHILDKDGCLEELGRLFEPFDVFFVGVHCPLPLLIEREKVRGDRPLGSAEQDFQTIHKGKTYDFEVDADRDANDNVGAILKAWQQRPEQSVFRSLAAAQLLVG